MTVREFVGINGRVDSAEVLRDFESSTKLDRVYIGKRGVFFRELLKMRFLDYSLLERVFIRVQEVNLKTCCGGSSTVYFRLVFVAGGNEICDVPSENEKAMNEALVLIHKNAPDIAIGFVK